MSQETLKTPAAVHVTTLEIGGLSCDGCVRHVTKSLSAREGVVYVHVDLKKNEAIIEHLPAYADDAALVASVQSGGYTARVASTVEDRKAEPSRLESPSGCGCGCSSFRTKTPSFDLGTSTIG